MNNVYNYYKLYIWFWLSSYGILFAILSYLDEMKLLPINRPIYLKGLMAIILGTLLFYFIPHNLEIKGKIYANT